MIYKNQNKVYFFFIIYILCFICFLYNGDMFLDIFGLREKSRYNFMIQYQFDVVLLDLIDNNDEVVYKDFFYKLKILINIEIDYFGREYSLLE